MRVSEAVICETCVRVLEENGIMPKVGLISVDGVPVILGCHHLCVIPVDETDYK